VNHPTAEELRALSAGQLTDAELARVSAHLADCPTCCRRIDELDSDDPLLARLQQRAAHRDERLIGPAQRRAAVRALRQGQVSQAAGAPRDGETAPVLRSAPTHIGDYEILAEVGRGGMGVVYQARHRGLRRLAALKMVLAGAFASPAQELRFRLEAELAARMQHPNIVQVYEIGTHEGRPFLAMEWVGGSSLANRLDDKPWLALQAAALIETLARAMHGAHEQGVIHRDLKPANILLAESVVRRPRSVAKERQPSENHDGRRTMADGLIPKIADFGLAKQLDVDAHQTSTGVLVGTPGYMAPEQAEGRSAEIGPATDVHALGVILYELLTGRPPFQGATTLQTLEQVRHQEPVPPCRLQPGVPRDLETICLKCLQKEPRHRYATAQDLADDLQRLREGKPIQARPAGLVEQGWKWARRRPALAGLLLVSALALFVGFPGVSGLWLQAVQEREAKEEQRLRADQEAQKALRQAYRGNLAAALASFNDHEVGDAAQYLQAAPSALRDWEWQHLVSRLDDSLAVVRLPDDEAVGLCPPGSGIVTAGNHQVRLWDALTGACRGTLTDDCSNRLTVVPTVKGPLLLVENRDRTGWRLYKPPLVPGAHGQELACALGRQVAGLSVDAEATRIGVLWRGQTDQENYFTVVEFGPGNRGIDFKGHASAVFGLAFSPDGTRIASGSADGMVGIWDTATGKNLVFLRGHTQLVAALMFSSDGSRLLTGSWDETVRQWDGHTGQPLSVRRGHKDRVLTVAYSPDGKWIASGGVDRTVRLWKAAQESDPMVLLGHTDSVYEVAFSPDGRCLGSVGMDRKARVWGLVPRDQLCCLRGHEDWIYPVAYSPDGALLASGGGDKTVRLWDAASGEMLAVLPHAEWVASLAFSPDGAWLVAGEWYGSMRIWDTATAQLQAVWISKEKPASVHGIAVSPDGARVIVAYARGPIPLQVWDRKSGQVVSVFRGHPGGVMGLTFRPDGQQLATCGQDGTVRLWDARTYELSAVWHGHDKAVNSVAYSADGRLLVSTGEDQTLRIWDVATGDCRAVLQGHRENVYMAMFHPDGNRIVSGGRDRFLRFWDVATGEEVARLPGHTSWIYSVAFSPDGTTLASGGGDATVRLWDTAPLARRLQAHQQSQAMRPEAERIVAHLLEELHEPSQVVQALRADSQLRDDLRREALKAVLRRSLTERE